MGVTCRERLAVIIALDLTCAEVADQVELFLCLHAFDNTVEAHILTQIQNGAQDICALFIAGKVAHEAAVDLERIDGKAVDIGETGKASAEIVDCDPRAGCLDFLKHFERAVEILQHRGLRYLEDKA